ncbi:hypothetical protein QQF64_005113 [Cirrhinus molitorella]|uniref:Uncharacterized protein n=1 Tax=Cirrhinus molitorella TaxID=172907 RepID=A0ABR3MI84_9TELE
MDLPQQLEKEKEKLKPLSGAHLNFALKRPSPETGRSLGNVTNWPVTARLQACPNHPPTLQHAQIPVIQERHTA